MYRKSFILSYFNVANCQFSISLHFAFLQAFMNQVKGIDVLRFENIENIFNEDLVLSFYEIYFRIHDFDIFVDLTGIVEGIIIRFYR